MPKLKTNKAARKRFKALKSGKIKRRRAFLRHILTSKARGRKMKLRRGTFIHPSDEKAIRQLLPYG